MKVFISDLHLGDGTKTDDFHRDEEFLDFLEFVEEGASELIILGDLFELWQADLDRIFFVHSKVINRLMSLRKKVKLSYIVGNHDYIPFYRFADKENFIRLEYRDSENSIVSEHGHRYDVFNRYANPLKAIKWPVGKYFSIMLAGLERYLHPNIDDWAKKIIERLDKFSQEAMAMRNKVTPASKEYLKRGGHYGEFQKAVEDYHTRGVKIVIFGHTHRPQIEKTEQGIYANCGTWVDGSTPTYIKYNNKSVSLNNGLTHKIIDEVELT